jgi:putative glutamine amidotransferase
VEFTTTTGSISRRLLGPRASAPCYHHQAMDRIAEDYASLPRRPTAR